MQRMRPWVHQAARLEISHGKMAWQWPYTTLTTRHIDGQSSETGQETSCRGHSRKGPDREQCAWKCLLVRVFGKQTLMWWGWRSRRALSHGHCASGIRVTVSPIWMDHHRSRNMKLRLYNMCLCSKLTHSCEAWNLTNAVSRILNGFNSRCLHVITREGYREPVAGRTTATSPLPGTLATSPAWQCSTPSTNGHDGWRQPLPGREPVHGLPGFRTERPWYPGSEPHRMAVQTGDMCFNNVTLHHWTSWVHYEHDDDDRSLRRESWTCIMWWSFSLGAHMKVHLAHTCLTADIQSDTCMHARADT